MIEDVSDYQFRRPNPQIRIISKIFWTDQGQVEEMLPVSIKGRAYIISSDESGGAGGAGGLPAACARGASAGGYPNIIDISDETNPNIVAKIRLEVSMAANCALMLNDPPDAGGGVIPNYSAERCTVDRQNNPTIAACGWVNAGLRVFDIRDPYRPKEVGALVPPAPTRMMDHRPNRARVIQSADVFVDAGGVIYSTDYNGGLYILEFNG